jgi:hypothetical protein
MIGVKSIYSMSFDLLFKLEYFKGLGGASDEGVFIQLKTELPAYMPKTSKEKYYESAERTAFTDGIFAIPGIVTAASNSFRVYVEKSPIFTWSQILGPLLTHIRISVGADSLIEAPGSPLTLTTENDRRSP